MFLSTFFFIRYLNSSPQISLLSITSLSLTPCCIPRFLSLSPVFIIFSLLSILFRREMYSDFRQHHVKQLPCLRCHPHSYIRMVQHLIERCLLLHLSRDQCIKALAEQASIRPQITLTVWRELQKENREFFHAYFHSIYPRRLTIRNYIQREARFTRRKHYWR